MMPACTLMYNLQDSEVGEHQDEPEVVVVEEAGIEREQ